ncbi:HAD-superfamily hydrolase, subfamily IIA [Chytridium lagenaria]|nr:HAD-superfamily hydrolase, subfamily IIA [Chytridium lagenaria]
MSPRMNAAEGNRSSLPRAFTNYRNSREQDYNERLERIKKQGNVLLPGVRGFVEWLQIENKKYLFLTNNSAPIAKELSEKLKRLGLDIPEKHFFTSAMCTAKFLQSQKPKGGTCYVIGEPALTYALYEAGFTMSSDSPDYVVIGEGSSHNFEKITIACNLVSRGAKLISTNPDANVPSADGIVPATGAFVGTIELATGKKAFTCGKPTSLMMTSAMAMLGSEKNETCIIGNRMDMDILAGIYAQIDSGMK